MNTVESISAEWVRRGSRFAQMTIGEALNDLAIEHPNSEALVFGEHRFTYQQIKEKADCLAMGLLRLGYRRGDHAAILMTNRPEWVYPEEELPVTLSPHGNKVQKIRLKERALKELGLFSKNGIS